MFRLQCVWMGVVVAVLAGSAGAWELPLAIQEYRGLGGLRHVSTGVPLLPGQARDAAVLRLVSKDEAGKVVPLPARFRVLARWWRRDNSIRWVLVDFTTPLGPREKRTFYLTDARLPAPMPAHPVRVEETPDRIVITTGPARFVVGRRRFRFLDAVCIDADRDGRFSPEENLLDPSADTGLVVEDTFGRRYYSAEETKSVEVVEAGPLRVQVRARGTFRDRDRRGYSRGMYDYDVFLNFYAGSSDVFADIIICNNPPRSRGAPTFEDASLYLRLRGGAKRYTILGDKGKAYRGALREGESICLYQDSNGAPTWRQCQGYNTERHDYWRFPEGKTASFRGYKVFRRSKGGEEELDQADHARGTARLEGSGGGLVVHMRNFWQQFPKAVEVAGDGTLRVSFFPREYKVPHFLEDATAKGHEVVFHFYAGGMRGPYPADSAGRPDAKAVADAWDAPILARPPLEHVCATGALADLGPYSVPVVGLDKPPSSRTAAYHPRMLTRDGLYGNAYGWQVFGERWRSCGGHSSRGARQPMNEDNYLYRWLLTGIGGWLDAGDARSRHFRDVRAYRIDGQDPFSFKDWNDLRSHNRSEDWTRRPQPTDEEARKYSRGRYPRATFWLPNPAHMTMDLIYDRYLLMGDLRAFENMRIIAAHGGYYAAYRPAVVHRATGWSWRAAFRYWERTGDRDTEKLLRLTIRRYRKMVEGPIKFPMRKDRKTGRQTVNWWFIYVFCRAAAMTALHMRDPDALLICKRLAEAVAAERRKHPQGYYPADFAEFHAVLYHLTGEERYRRLVLGDDDGKGLLRVTGGMKLPACAHWLAHQPPEPPIGKRRPRSGDATGVIEVSRWEGNSAVRLTGYALT